METLRKELSPEERQANIDRLINRLITNKKEALAEIQADFQRPEVQNLFKKIRNKKSHEKANIGV